MSEATILSAAEHFEALHETVWVKFRSRHGAVPRDRFEDAYSEWWTRELERAAAGRPSSADAPAAFVAEAVHRVLIDDGRALARGIGRAEKHALEIADLADQADAAGSDDTASQAHYETLAHRLLALVRDTLTPREIAVFVWSFLYLRPSEETAAALGLSLPRVKKDRKKIATKVGQEVWAVLSGELDLCTAYDDKRLQAVFEILTSHAEDCPVCRAALGGVRRGALAVVGPFELLAIGGIGGSAGVGDVLSDLVTRWSHRVAEFTAATPSGGRATAVAAVAATAVAGGAATVTLPDRPSKPQERRAAVAPPRVGPAATPRPEASTVEPRATATPRASTAGRRATHRAASHRRAAAAASREPIASASSFERQAPVETFEQRAPAPQSTPTSPKGGEFGFERG